MKIIISRKGFDSSFGGCPSPILPDGALASLPIPGDSGATRFGDIVRGGMDLGAISQALGGQPASRHLAHLDPDLRASDLPRLEGWRGSLGQTGAARSHLAAQGVDVGDIFLFFGWFRQTCLVDGRLARDKSAEDIHCLFGYLQVGEIVELGARPDAESHLAARPWLAGHPHLSGERDANNALYIGASRLAIPGRKTSGTLAGWGSFETFSKDLALTDPNAESRSNWLLPDFFGPDGFELSYHGSGERWGEPSDGRRSLRAVAKGQEFVADIGLDERALSWVASLVDIGMSPKLNPQRAPQDLAKAKLAARRASARDDASRPRSGAQNQP